MSARLRPAFLLAACALALVACDTASDGAGTAGVWEGTANFRADTLLAAQNYRIRADYAVNYRFTITHEDGLAWGTLEAAYDGTLIAREAGRPADTLRFSAQATRQVDNVYGTYQHPTFEVDVPGGPYDDDLWTFGVVGDRADLTGKLAHTWKFRRLHVAQGEASEFSFTLTSGPGTFRMRRVGSVAAPEAGQPSAPASRFRVQTPAHVADLSRILTTRR